jgi:dsDNA-binding SOS-regulon protein
MAEPTGMMELAKAELDAASKAVVDLEGKQKADLGTFKANQRTAMKLAKKAETKALNVVGTLNREASRNDARAKATPAKE